MMVKKIIRSLFLTIIFDVTTEGQGTFFHQFKLCFRSWRLKDFFFSNITEKGVNKETSSLLRSSSYVNRWARFLGTKELNRFKLGGWFIVVLQILQRPGLSQKEKKTFQQCLQICSIFSWYDVKPSTCSFSLTLL